MFHFSNRITDPLCLQQSGRCWSWLLHTHRDTSRGQSFTQFYTRV